ncbi:6-phospho-beta-glucosidase [Intrasporangium oryzae NRRL B-24470]|uniref:6-phospho-beta-glucosidase n=1 Tax=Intrasporangium oryzae NRRL B-24470 TaxID=1386089 RepID=W9G7R0_9MICO|nr:6-phospho-beta-glucosidase [Intrasporangium oryzae]EWT01317.1 6-phospho-beta-glucosidase [Intrasporangium oryzae NRRL B-24470]
MRLAILGGGGFRVPLVHGALLTDASERRVDEVVLYDTDQGRLAAIARVVAQQAERAEQTGTGRARGLPAPRVTTTTDLDVAVEGADFVFSAVRVGGLEGRTADERVALDLGLLGQETTGPGGLAYGLRTVPVAVAVAERVRALAPDAWVINFTNPAGMVTQAMQSVLGERVVGICDSPLGLAKRAASALGHSLDEVEIDYAGLNHLGWLQGLRADGRDLLPELLADPVRLGAIEEGHLFGVEWLQTLGALPNEYLYYFYFTRDAIASITDSRQTRGEFLLGQQTDFYAAVRDSPDRAFDEWDRVRRERNATYMQETREQEGQERDEADVEGGGYEGVALALMAAIARDEPARLILNVRNGDTVPGLPDDAVVEVPCTVTAAGPRPSAVTRLPGHALGLAQQVKAVDELVITAAAERSVQRAVEAFALHPLVDSVTVARQLVAGYRAAIPALDAVFARG